MNKMVHGGKTLLQTKADRAKGNAVGESDIPDKDGEDNDDDDDEEEEDNYNYDWDDIIIDNDDVESVHDNGVFLVIWSEQYTTTNISQLTRFTVKYQPINSEGTKGGRQHCVYGGKSGDGSLLHKLHSTQHFHAITYQ